MTLNKTKTITFLNLAAQSPSLELGLAVSNEIQEKNNSSHTFYVCKSALKSCSVNIKNNKSVCHLCVTKALRGVKLYKKKNPNTEYKFITKKDLEKFSANKIDKDDLKQVELGVKSTIASQFRIREVDNLEKKWSKYYRKMLDSSINLFHYFNYELNSLKPIATIVFNGRLSCARPVKLAAEKTNNDFFLFDASNNGKYPVLAKNRMFHSIEFVRDYSLKIYLKNIHSARNAAKNFMNSKLTNKSVDDAVFTSHQIKKYIDPKITIGGKKIISIFTSSDDEYRYIGSDWGQHVILDQVQEILKLNSSELKMHPNQKYIHKSDASEYKKLSNEMIVLFPEDKTDTYELINISEYIISFCSLIAVEANFMRKKVIQIGPSIFMKLPVANYVKNSDECIKKIKDNDTKIMPLRASIIYFNYLSNSNCELKSYEYVNDGVFLFNQNKIKTNFFVRTISTFNKLLFTCSVDVKVELNTPVPSKGRETPTALFVSISIGLILI